MRLFSIRARSLKHPGECFLAHRNNRSLTQRQSRITFSVLQTALLQKHECLRKQAEESALIAAEHATPHFNELTRGSEKEQPTGEKGVQMEANSRCALRYSVGNTSATSNL
jgi:hypothetical protein